MGYVHDVVNRSCSGEIPADVIKVCQKNRLDTREHILGMMARGMYENGRYQTTLDFYLQYWEHVDKSDISTHNIIASCHMRLGNHHAAIRSLEFASNFGANKDEISYSICCCCQHALGNHESYLESAVQGKDCTKSNKQKICFVIEEAWAHYELQQYKDAITLLDASEHLVSEFGDTDQQPRFYHIYIKMLKLSKDCETMIRVYERSSSIIRKAESHIYAAEYYVEHNQIDKAKAALVNYMDTGGHSSGYLLEIQMMIAAAESDPSLDQLCRAALAQGLRSRRQIVTSLLDDYQRRTERMHRVDPIQHDQRHSDHDKPDQTPWELDNRLSQLPWAS